MLKKMQRPQIMPPSAADLRNEKAMGEYMQKLARAVNNTFAEVYAKLSAMEETAARAKAAKGEGENG